MSRSRLLVILLIASLAVLMLLLQCLNPLRLRLCCTEHIAYDAYDYAYDETVEGSNKIRYHHTKRCLPQALIIGVRKGGTRALLEFLNLHPDIQAQKREMHFFDQDQSYNKGLEWYRKKMPYSFKGQITIEKTPAYFTTELVPERVYQMNSSLLLLLVVRDPVERAISDYTQIHANKLYKHRPHEPFEKLVLDEQGDIRRSYAAIRRSIYHRHLHRWLEFFPLKQLHFVSSEMLVTDPVHELGRVESFLGLRHVLDDDFFYFNVTKGFYCIRKPLPSSSAAVAVGRHKGKTKEKCLADSKGRTHPHVDKQVVRKMRQFFAPHNAKFFEMVNSDRFNWSTT